MLTALFATRCLIQSIISFLVVALPRVLPFFGLLDAISPGPIGLGKRLSIGPLPCSAARSFISVLPGSPLGLFKNVEDSHRNRRMQRSWDVDPIIFASYDHRLT